MFVLAGNDSCVTALVILLLVSKKGQVLHLKFRHRFLLMEILVRLGDIVGLGNVARLVFEIVFVSLFPPLKKSEI